MELSTKGYDLPERWLARNTNSFSAIKVLGLIASRPKTVSVEAYSGLRVAVNDDARVSLRLIIIAASSADIPPRQSPQFERQSGPSDALSHKPLGLPWVA
jgi:hypothetical protein